ncbi:hypothetical protein B0H19DRAFT_1249219 [Mycena capillaripes]|nr:hypothetical protein B0H19DRAFT_1249219 [Mycena capillaripes]
MANFDIRDDGGRSRGVRDDQLTSHITNLSAPAAYIHHILPAALNAQEISIHFPKQFSKRVMTQWMDAIASLPGAHPISLALFFTRFSAPLGTVTPLPRVAKLLLSTDAGRQGSLDPASLARWLAQAFPQAMQFQVTGFTSESRNQAFVNAVRNACVDAGVSVKFIDTPAQ